MDEIINDIYIKNNYPALEKLYLIVKSKHPDVKRKTVQEFLESQQTYQLLKQTNASSANGHITAFEPNEIWQVDIYVMKKYETYNKNYGYMFAVIDVFTRRASVRKMKNKNAEDCATALQDIIFTWKVSPRVIMSDNDKAYAGSEYQRVLNKYNIILDENVVGDHNALGIVDRFARTLKTIITHHFVHNKTKNWIDKIDDIITTYNDTYHRGLNYYTPNEAMDEKNYNEVLYWNVIKNQENKTVSDLKVDDKVRIKISGMFTKGTEPNWSEEFYTVKKVNGTTITLSNDKRYKRTNLLKIPRATEAGTTKNIIREVTRENRGRQIRNREDINENNIIPEERQRRNIKKPSRYDV